MLLKSQRILTQTLPRDAAQKTACDELFDVHIQVKLRARPNPHATPIDSTWCTYEYSHKFVIVMKIYLPGSTDRELSVRQMKLFDCFAFFEKILFLQNYRRRISHRSKFNFLTMQNCYHQPVSNRAAKAVSSIVRIIAVDGKDEVGIYSLVGKGLIVFVRWQL
ncbi:hypothetical protein Plhal304r1_c019g0069561 [Plasmopara halstedii]